jgi:DNA-binding transcriptional LysR family regulator
MNESQPVDLVLLHTFHEVARLGSVTKAARELNRSQPAISHRIRALEQELAVPLFEKIGRRLKLTEYGRRLQERCFDLIALSRSIRDVARGSGDDVEGRIAIGALPTVVSHLLVPAIASLIERYPKLHLSFVFGYVPELCDHLRTGRVDLIVVIGGVEATGLTVTDLGSTDLVAVMAPALAPRKSGTIELAELREHRYLAWDGPRDVTFDLVDEFVRRHGLADAYTPGVPHIESLRLLAAAGAGYAILPRYTISADRDRLVALRPSRLRRRLPVSLVTRRQQLATPALQCVAAAIEGIELPA